MQISTPVVLSIESHETTDEALEQNMNFLFSFNKRQFAWMATSMPVCPSVYICGCVIF